jgi:hypothetical protein
MVRPAMPSGRAARAFVSLFLVFIYLAVSSLVLHVFMDQWELVSGNRGNGFLGLVDRTAVKPWIYRVLTPGIVNATTAAIPPTVKQAIAPLVMTRSHLLPYPKFRDTPDWTLDNAIKYHVAYFFMFACLFASLYAFRAATAAVFSPPRAWSDFAPAIATLLLPLTFLRGGYMYDFAELLLMGLATLFLARGRWWLFYPVLVLAILNKESNVLLVLFFAAFAWDRMPRRALFLHLGAQTLLGVGLVVALRQIYAGAPGLTMQFNLWRNLAFLLKPSSYFMFVDVYAPMIPAPRGFNLLTLALLAFLVGWRWREKPVALRRLLVLTAIFNLPLFLFGGYTDELRNLSFVFPAIYLLGFDTLFGVYSAPRAEAAR